MHSGSSMSWMLAAVLLVTVLVAEPATAQINRGQKQGHMMQRNPQTANTKKVSDSVTNLAQRIASAIANQKSKTEIFSPVSIAGALSLLLLGSGGKTQTELLNVMGLSTQDLSFRDIHISFGRLFQDLVSNEPSLEPLVTWRMNDKCNRLDDSEDYEDEPIPESPNKQNELASHQISVANGVFLQRGLKPSGRFLQMTKEFYNGTIANFDFVGDPNGAAAAINDWCAKATRNKIQEIVTPDVLLSSRMIVANALYFKAQWETTFSPFGTRQRTFYINGRSQPPVQVESMATSGCFPYYNASEYNLQIIGLPYKKGISTMYIIVNNESNRQNLQRTMSWLNSTYINWMIGNMATKKGMVTMPKLSISNRFHLRSLLGRLGLHDLFDPSQSNLYNVLEEKAPNMKPPKEPTQNPRPVSRFEEETTTRQPERRPAQSQQPIQPPIRQGQQQQRPQQETHQSPRPQSRPDDTRASKLVFPFDSISCSLIESCEAAADNAQKCVCSRTPITKEDSICRNRVAGIYTTVTNKMCLFTFTETIAQKLTDSHICINPGYHWVPQLTNPDTCLRMYGCKMFQNKCYCCTQSMQSHRPQNQNGLPMSTVPQTAIYNINTGSSHEQKVCYSAELLHTPTSCNQRQMHYWDSFHGICIDQRTCRHSRTKRQQSSSPYFSQPLAQPTQEKLALQPETQSQPIYFPQSKLQQQHQSQYQQQSQPPQQYSQQQQQQYSQQQQPQFQFSQELQKPQVSQQVPPQESNRQQEPLYVSEIITQVKLDVNEQGTEGGAVTAALIDRIGPNFSFNVDSPFLLLIREDKTALPLFYGAVYDPRP
uniref:Serpin domain-containing protein n=1 Tax=Anopheles farauti TaxID=69004 RepID=A0A182QZQ1_9DIPT